MEEVSENIDRDGETQTFKADACQFEIVDADDFTSHVEEWATRVSRVDFGCRLHEHSSRNEPVCKADDALGNRSVESERGTDGEDRLSLAEFARAGERHGGEIEIIGLFDFQECEIHGWRRGDDADIFEMHMFEFVRTLFENGDRQPVLARNDVLIGDDVAVVVDDKA